LLALACQRRCSLGCASTPVALCAEAQEEAALAGVALRASLDVVAQCREMTSPAVWEQVVKVQKE